MVHLALFDQGQKRYVVPLTLKPKISYDGRMKKGLRRKFKAGFTIVEVAMAATVMTIVFGSALSVLARGFNVMDSSRAVSYSSQIMQSELEKMRLTGWTDVNAYPKDEWRQVTLDSNFFSAGDIGSRMTLERKAHDVHTGMIEITLRMSWTTMDGRAVSQSYITYYGQKGLYDLFTY